MHNFEIENNKQSDAPEVLADPTDTGTPPGSPPEDPEPPADDQATGDEPEHEIGLHFKMQGRITVVAVDYFDALEKLQETKPFGEFVHPSNFSIL